MEVLNPISMAPNIKAFTEMTNKIEYSFWIV